MKREVAALAMIGLLFVAGAPVGAQTYGATGVLKIKPGDVPDGMGQAGVALHQGPLSMWWNPALLAQTRHLELQGNYARLVPDLADDVHYLNLAATCNWPAWGGLGLELMFLSYGETEAVDTEGTSHGTFDSHELVPALGFGTRMWGPRDWAPGAAIEPIATADAGIAVKYVSVDLAPDWAMEAVGMSTGGQAGGPAMDLGGLLQGGSAILNDGALTWSFGFNIQNLGPDLAFIDSDQGDPLPRNLKLGIGGDFRLGRTQNLFDGRSSVDVLCLRGALDYNHSLITYPDPTDLGGKPGFGWGDTQPIWNAGAELTILGIGSVRVGHIADPAGEIEDYTYGLGLHVQFEEMALHVGYASVPQALDLDRVGYCGAALTYSPRVPLPSVPAPLDSDGDGVPDSEDRESNTPPGAVVDRYGIALDDDGDGVPNGIDRDLHTVVGDLVDEWGVAIDGDHDGVPDTRDHCSDTPADWQVDSDGCEIEVIEIEDKIIDLGQFEERRIYFDTGKSELLPESFRTLDVIGLALSDLPELLFEVGGHCDDRGSDEYNQVLSEERAQAVIDYLLASFPGLTSAQLIPRGHGRSRPIAPGTDEASRAQNRRVEFRALNPEAARQQIERKRYLRRGE